MRVMLARVLPGLLCATALLAQTTQYKWLRQLGGTGDDTVVAVGVDRDGNTYIAGNTNSFDYPTTPNARQPRQGGANLNRFDLAGGSLTPLQVPGGVFGSLAVDPGDPAHLYGVLGGNLAVSSDGGATWTTTRPPEGVHLSTIAVKSGVVYAGTDGQGIYRYTDGWTRSSAGLPDRLTVYRIVVDPANPAIFHALTGLGYYRSEDSGATWSQTATNLSDLAFSPDRAGVMYAAGERLLRSSDYGRTWSALGAFPVDYTYAYSIFSGVAAPSTLYAFTNNGIYRSIDEGATWAVVPDARIGASTVADPVSEQFYTFLNNHVNATRDFVTFTPIGPPIAYSQTLKVVGGVLYAASVPTPDVFVTKLDPDGNTVYSTFLGGVDYDQVAAMAVTPEGAVYIAGQTSSPDFPLTPGAYSSKLGQYGTAFVAKLDPDGSLAWSTSYGAPISSAAPRAIAVDPAGNVYVSGVTTGNIPVVTPGASRAPNLFFPPPQYPFLVRFKADGSGIVFSNYIPETGGAASGLTLGKDGTPYVATPGKLWRIASADGAVLGSLALVSNETATLATAGDGSIYMGGSTLVIRRFTPDLVELSHTQIGQDSYGNSVSLSIAADGRVLAAGGTASSKFPTYAPLQGIFASSAGFLTALTPDLSGLLIATYVGDERPFAAAGAVGIGDDVVFAGSTLVSYGNDPRDADAFVARIAPAVPAVRLDAVRNAASLTAAPLAPGEVIVVAGDHFLVRPRLTIAGKPATVLASTAQSIVAAVPAGIDETRSVTVQADNSNEVVMPARSYSPGIYTVDRSGGGQAYILNKDGTLNGSSNPAAEGDPITIYANGISSAAAPINVFIDGFYASGIDAQFGPVEGFTGDVYRVRVYIPRPSDWVDRNPDLKGFKMPPQVPVTLSSGGVTSQYTAFLSVR